MIQTHQALLAIVVIGLVTFGLRALPFWIARWIKSSPRVMALGRFLPSAIMVLLMIHSLRDLAQRSASPHYLAELVCVAVVLILQWYKRQPLVSILVGTGLYMAWLNLI